jgi:hypothetical protein
VAPYESIFDAKTPLSGIGGGTAVAIERRLTTADDGVRDVHTVRMLFFLFACLAVLGIYILAAGLFGSPLAGLVSASVLAAFNGFARDATGGPDPKTAGVLFAVATMALLVERRWFWGGFASALAFLSWQPLLIYVALALVVAGVGPTTGNRRRGIGLALAGAVVPVAATALYFLAMGAFGDMIDAVFVFPATQLTRPPMTFTERVSQIADRAENWYGGAFFWTGLGLFLALVAVHVVRGWRRPGLLLGRDPLVNVVFASFLATTAYTLYDFQGYPDLFPFLPYAALGFGGLAGLLRLIDHDRLRTIAGIATIGGVVLIIGLAFSSFSAKTGRSASAHALEREQLVARRIGLLVPPGGVLYVAGNSRELVLLQRRNPDRYIYLASGIAGSLVRRYGGLDGWTDRIQSARPDVVVVDARGPYGRMLRRWVETRYARVPTGRRSTAFISRGAPGP